MNIGDKVLFFILSNALGVMDLSLSEKQTYSTLC